jgi:hypothetical protein
MISKYDDDNYMNSYQDTDCFQLYGKFSGVSSGLIYYLNDALYPGGDTKTQDLGISILAWDNVYAHNYVTVADFPYLDDQDDLAAIKQIKPLIRDGEEVKDISGNTLIDDDTLPDFLLHRFEKDQESKTISRPDAEDIILPGYKKGDIARTSDGKPFIPLRTGVALAWGACKQLDTKIEELTRRIEALEYKLNSNTQDKEIKI